MFRLFSVLFNLGSWPFTFFGRLEVRLVKRLTRRSPLLAVLAVYAVLCFVDSLVSTSEPGLSADGKQAPSLGRFGCFMFWLLYAMLNIGCHPRTPVWRKRSMFSWTPSPQVPSLGRFGCFMFCGVLGVDIRSRSVAGRDIQGESYFYACSS